MKRRSFLQKAYFGVGVLGFSSLPSRIAQGKRSTEARHGAGLNQQFKWQSGDRVKY